MMEPGCVLVAVAYSLISAGTEMSSLQSSSESLIKKALKQPEKVNKLLKMVQKQGLKNAFDFVEGKLSSVSALGYSCSGTVIQVAADITDIHPGDRVACAGAGKANHAEWVVVPRNLVTRIPDGVSLRDAASTTLGAIAMQGVRRADLRLGEWAAVIGLGLLGQITVQLLRASGVNVIGFDLEPARVEKAKSAGLTYGFISNEIDPVVEVQRLTQKYGVDAAIITAASKSDVIVQQAVQMTRKKGKVVVVGAVGMGLRRSPLYEKEIDFLISCSYGPGRYDPTYEEKGVDYPYAYVRWTENRNMAEYLNLIENRQVNFSSLVDAEFSIDQAVEAYASLQAPHPPTAVLFHYPAADQPPTENENHKIPLTSTSKAKSGIIRVAVVGAGSFAQSMHLPNLKQLPSLYHLQAVVSKTGLNARNVGTQFGAKYATTDYQDVLNDPDVDMVMICTRHNLHAQQIIQAAQAGKAVFVEKPMALTLKEIDEIEKTLAQHPVPFMVGFNRRFSPSATRAKEILSNNPGPLMLMYRVNAGYIPLNHWVHGSEGGGRIIGEACHMLDLLKYLVSPAKVESYQSTAIRPSQDHLSASDNVTISIRYADGSVATLLYTSLGTADFPKEYLEIYAGDRVLVMDDFKSLRVHGASLKGWQSDIQDKGHINELRAFAAYVAGKADAPISLSDLIETTRLTIQVSQNCK
jgi:predicted dehydrogenase/threonine dehydrogenase-like Zn-dependent dehydrogenase